MGKTMYSPNTKKPARSNEPLDWSTFFLADMMRIERKMDGLAYVLTSGIVFIDVDGCFDKYGTVSPLAQELMDEFPGAYAERSCSGSGLHIFVKGSLPENSMKRNDEIGLEMYDTKRFCCLTGDSLPGRTEIIDYSSKISDVASRYLGIKKPLPIITSPASLPIPDGEVIRKASTAKNGRKFLQLYSGDLSGYPSHSNADMALCNILAYWCNGPEQIDRIFRSSGLMRDKWDSPRGKSTYGFTTIEAAMSMRVVGPSTEAF